MSIKLILSVLNLEDENISANETLLLIVMANFSKDDGMSIFPSVDLIVKKTRLDKRTIRGCIKKLILKGLIVRNIESKKITNEYIINVNLLTLLSIKSVDNSVDNFKSEESLKVQKCTTVKKTTGTKLYQGTGTKLYPGTGTKLYQTQVQNCTPNQSINQSYLTSHIKPVNLNIKSEPETCEVEELTKAPSIDASVDQSFSESVSIDKIKKTRNKKDLKPSLLDENGNPVSISDQFNRFWASYPRKVGRSACERVFARVINKTSLLELLNAISEQKVERDKKISLGLWVPPEICYPLTWLNQGRWLNIPMSEDQINEQAKQNIMNKVSYKDMKNIQQGYESWSSMRETKFLNDNNLSQKQFRDMQENGFSLDSHFNKLNSNNDLKNIIDLNSNSLPWDE